MPSSTGPMSPGSPPSPPTLSQSSRWDMAALRAGGLVSLTFAIPFAFGARWAADNDNQSLATWLAFFALIGFVLGGGCAAWVQQRDLPLSHALAAAVGTYVIAQTVFIVIALVRGREVNWFAAFFNLTAVAAAGLVGGLLGKRLRDKGLLPSANKPHDR